MLYCYAFMGFVLGIAVSQLFLDGRVDYQKHLRHQAEEQAASSLEHEAYLRKQIEKLREDNAYLRAVNERRKLEQ